MPVRLTTKKEKSMDLKHAIWQFVLREQAKQVRNTTLVHVGSEVVWLDKSGRLVLAVIVEIHPDQTRARIRVGEEEVWVGADEITTPRRTHHGK
jgi:hypothetical protein